jgi:hypothetical protein
LKSGVNDLVLNDPSELELSPDINIEGLTKKEIFELKKK